MTSKGYDAVATGDNVTVTAQTMHGLADDTRIDEWELTASRRILANLRHRLYRDEMYELIKDQVAESDRLMKQYVEESGGEFDGTQVIITAKELTVAKYAQYLRRNMGSTDGNVASGLMASTAKLKEVDDQARDLVDDMVFPMHPEHYTVPPNYPGVIETMGGLPTRSHVQPLDMKDMPEFVTRYADPSAPICLTGTAYLDDGTRFTYVLQQYTDTPEGLRIDLRIWYPAACPPIYLSEHAQHYSVEFRNGLRQAAGALREAGV